MINALATKSQNLKLLNRHNPDIETILHPAVSRYHQSQQASSVSLIIAFIITANHLSSGVGYVQPAQYITTWREREINGLIIGGNPS